MNKELYKQLSIIAFLFFGIVFFLFASHISISALLIYSGLVVSLYVGERLFSLDFHKEHYTFVSVLALSFLFFYYLHSLFVYVDKPLHFFGGFVIAFLFYHALKQKKFRKKSLIALIFFLSLLVILGYELYEFTLDRLFDAHMQGVYRIVEGKRVIMISGVQDTVQDILLGMLGILGSFFVVKK
ncbi:MAG: hypothetical protein RL557_219 [archaeon]|jgi:hypothetical protein